MSSSSVLRGEGSSEQKDLHWVNIGGACHVLECLMDEDD
jgi:hypothetical protein